MLKGILNWLSGGVIQSVTDGLLKAQQQYLQAQNDSEKLIAQQSISYWQQRMELAQTAALNDRPWSIRSLMGYVVCVYVFKLVIWDTVLGWGVTPDPGPVVGTIVATVIAFYFLSKPAETVANALASRWIKKA